MNGEFVYEILFRFTCNKRALCSSLDTSGDCDPCQRCLEADALTDKNLSAICCGMHRKFLTPLTSDTGVARAVLAMLVVLWAAHHNDNGLPELPL